MTCHNILRDNDLNAVPLPSQIKNVEHIKFLQNCAPVCALIFFFFFLFLCIFLSVYVLFLHLRLISSVIKLS